ncbi:hypothetical protein [Asticcacaulis machinosus]|uniref:HTH deoR-type domain-containing protein n=1 Tax=Asticcacaulis machinosus TaxID=2984211 RepID=A0ABT5HFU6_9CAUL|nr:hypothetical protein [Asticcacaulis machinosus]MDC7675136.1 hypothetical protein [Asticcacaulis machinosus]
MSPLKTGRLLGRKKAADEVRRIASTVSDALREDFGDSPSAIKQIGRITGASLNTIANWYRARNMPSSNHLLVLARSSPTILVFVVREIGGDDLVDAFETFSRRRTSTEVSSTPPFVRSINVSNNGTLNGTISLNRRQTWFVSELSKGHACDARNIVNYWKVSIRTARRDLAELLRHKRIRYIGAKRKGMYEIQGLGGSP